VSIGVANDDAVLGGAALIRIASTASETTNRRTTPPDRESGFMIYLDL
jgi:hypothetical protein